MSSSLARTVQAADTSVAGPHGPGARTRIGGVAIANPENSLSQDEVLGLLGLRGDEFAERIFARCGVKKRSLALSPQLLRTSLQERTPETEEQLFGLSLRAVGELGLDPGEVGTVITATYYSLGGPTLAHRIVDHYGMDPATDKYHVLGVGCASAVPLFKLAAQTLRDQPGKKGLVVAADSITGFLTGVAPDDGKSKVVGSSLFGDGCAAAVLTAEGDPEAKGPVILSSKVHQLGGTLDAVRFRLEAQDSFMHIGRDLPAIAEAALRALVDDFLGESGVTAPAIDHWLVHPGGRGIIEGVQRGLSLTDEDVAVSYDVLADHGNMGTPSTFYVLKQTQERRTPRTGELGLMVTIGPGVTIGLALLQW
jgi:predicted naringenin-chalcone synthase